MSIAIIGAGNVGQALAHALTQRGEAVYLGVPDPDKYRTAVAALGAQAQLGTVAAAIAACPVVILAVPYAAAEQIARSIPDWAGKILVDATNPLAPGLSGLSLGTDTSGAEQIAAAAGLAPRTFFSYFATKDDLVLADYTDRLRRILEELQRRPATEPAWEALRSSFATVAEHYEAEESRIRRRFTIMATSPSVAARSARVMLR